MSESEKFIAEMKAKVFTNGTYADKAAMLMLEEIIKLRRQMSETKKPGRPKKDAT